MPRASDSDVGMVLHVAERIQNRLRAGQAQPAIHVSMGSGLYPEDGRTAAGLMEAADRLLYQSKRELRSQPRGLPASNCDRHTGAG